MLEPRLVVIPGHDDVAVADAGVSTFIPHERPAPTARPRVASAAN